MKHLSFILALVLILTCASLASCNSDSENSSAAESSVNESSYVEESSEAAESSEQQSAEPKLISKGCKYEVPGGKGYVVQHDQWPANYSADLTDGAANNKLAYDSTWFSFNSEPDSDGKANRIDGVGTVIVDLGDEKTVTSARTNVYVGSVPSASIASVGTVTISFSDDGKEFGTPITLNMPETSAEVGWAACDIEPTSARYVKLEYTVRGEGYHMFINEIEIYGY